VAEPVLWLHARACTSVGRLSPAERDGAESGTAGMVEAATQYRWCSARAHVCGNDSDAILDMEWWEREGRWWRLNWASRLLEEDREGASALRACTYAGRPFADDAMVKELGQRFHRT
jgi:hypothetical protein